MSSEWVTSLHSDLDDSNAGDLGLIPGLGRSPGEGKGYGPQYSGLENSMDCIVAKSMGYGVWRRDRLPTPVFFGISDWSDGKESACNAGDPGSIPGLGRSPKEEKGYPLQHSGLENSMDCIVAKSQTWLSEWLALSLGNSGSFMVPYEF